MPRCSSCNKFASVEMAEPEISDEEFNDGRVTGTVRLVQTCAECGEELAEANIDFEIPVEFKHNDVESEEEVCTCGHAEDEHGENGTCTIEGCSCAGWEPADPEMIECSATEDLEVEVEAENDERFEGKGRYAKHFYTANIRAKVTCPECKAEAEGETTVEEQASSFEPLN